MHGCFLVKNNRKEVGLGKLIQMGPNTESKPGLLLSYKWKISPWTDNFLASAEKLGQFDWTLNIFMCFPHVKAQKMLLILSTQSLFCSLFTLLFGADDLSVFKKKKKKESKQLKGMCERVGEGIFNARYKNTMKKNQKRAIFVDFISPMRHLEWGSIIKSFCKRT